MSTVRRYGVREQAQGADDTARAAEDIRLLGYTVISGGFSAAELKTIAGSLDEALVQSRAAHGGHESLSALDEQHIIRAVLSFDQCFTALACNPAIMEICEALLGPYFVLNQQNGLFNSPREAFSQGAFHRDLPYQHFVSSRPLALSALFCIDDFTLANGATQVIPASHKSEAFPTDEAIAKHAGAVPAPAGSFLVMDAMLYHSAGLNCSSEPRRGVNHLYTLPFIAQQISLPRILGARPGDPAVARLLGYDVQAADSVEDFYERKRKRLGIVES